MHAAAGLAHFGSGFGELFAHLLLGRRAFLGRCRRGRVRLLGQRVGQRIAELPVARLPFRDEAEPGRQVLDGIGGGFELQGCGAVVGIGLVGVQRLDVLDDGEEQPPQGIESVVRLAGGAAGLGRRRCGAGDAFDFVHQRRQAGGRLRAQRFGLGVALFRRLPSFLVRLLLPFRSCGGGGRLFLQERLQPFEALSVLLAQGEYRLRAFGAVELGAGAGGLGVQQRDDAALAGIGELHQFLDASEPLDGLRQGCQRLVLSGHGGGRIRLFKRRDGIAHRRQAAVQNRHRFRDCLQRTRIFFVGRLWWRSHHRLEPAEHAAAAGGDVLLAFGEMLVGQPCGHGLVQLQGFVAKGRERRGVVEQLQLIAHRRLQHLHRVQQLLAGALQFGQRRIGAAVAALALQAPEQSPRVAQGLARALQIVGQGRQLVGAALLFHRAFLGRRLLDEQALLGGQVDAVAHFRQQRPLAAGQRLERAAETERFGTGLLGFDVHQQSAHVVAQAALIVDQAVEARFQAIALVQLVGEFQNAPRYFL